jgi:hypothetical protein
MRFQEAMRQLTSRAPVSRLLDISAVTTGMRAISA